MRKLIIGTVVVAVISLSFTAVNVVPLNTKKVTSQKSQQLDFSPQLDEKRLASWD